MLSFITGVYPSYLFSIFTSTGTVSPLTEYCEGSEASNECVLVNGDWPERKRENTSSSPVRGRERELETEGFI